jgi:hypothetical protein
MVNVLDPTLADDINDLAYKPVCKLIQGSAQSIPNSTATAVTFGVGSEDIDTHGFHDTSVNPSRVTPNVAGYYRVTATYASAANTANQLVCNIAKNGTTVQPFHRETPAATSAAKNVLNSTIVQCDGVSDYIEMYVTQNSGGALNTQASGGLNSVLEVELSRLA